jgi:hypothetical protein
MRIMIWAGAVLTLAGVLGLIGCIRIALKARREAADDADLRARLQRVVTLNLGALGLSALGLMLVVAGILLS